MAMSKERANEIAKRIGSRTEADSDYDKIPPEEPRLHVELFQNDRAATEIKIDLKGQDSIGVECSSETWYDDFLQFVGVFPDGQVVNVRLFWRDLPIYKAIRKQLIKNGHHNINEDYDHERG